LRQQNWGVFADLELRRSSREEIKDFSEGKSEAQTDFIRKTQESFY
jgi:hypothetical protein